MRQSARGMTRVYRARERAATEASSGMPPTECYGGDMPMPIPVRCRCGEVRGALSGVSPSDRTLGICYCDDCQIYAQHLGRGDTLDDRGGTTNVIVTPAQLTLSAGSANLRCLRLSPNGVYRWYAGCCKTPIGNTPGPRMPVLIVPAVALDLAATGQSLEALLGPPILRIWGRFARGGTPPGADAKMPLRILPEFALRLLRGLLAGRAKPSPFFDDEGAPRVAPELIDRAERELIRGRILAAASA